METDFRKHIISIHQEFERRFSALNRICQESEKIRDVLAENLAALSSGIGQIYIPAWGTVDPLNFKKVAADLAQGLLVETLSLSKLTKSYGTALSTDDIALAGRLVTTAGTLAGEFKKMSSWML